MKQEFTVIVDKSIINVEVILSETIYMTVTDVSKPEKIEIITTNTTTHFTNQFLTNEFENENITGLSANNCIICGVSIQSKQSLHFKLVFWKKNTFNNVSLNLDTYIGDIDLDLTTNPAFKIGNNTYRLNVEDTKLVYQDLNLLTTLHMSLLNLSNETKQAGVNGEVKLDIKVSPRL